MKVISKSWFLTMAWFIAISLFALIVTSCKSTEDCDAYGSITKEESSNI